MKSMILIQVLWFIVTVIGTNYIMAMVAGFIFGFKLVKLGAKYRLTESDCARIIESNKRGLMAELEKNLKWAKNPFIKNVCSLCICGPVTAAYNHDFIVNFDQEMQRILN